MANKKIKQRVKIGDTEYDIQFGINTIAGLDTILSSKMDKELTVGSFSANNNYLPLAVLNEDGKYYLKANTNFKFNSSKANYVLTQAGTWKLDNNHNHDTSYADINHNHDTSYADISHNHPISEVTGLQAALDNKAASNHNHDTSYADISHTHDTSYAGINHNHDTVYSKLTHKHDSIYHSKQTLGVPRINLGNPLITEQALFDTQYNNKSEFHPISKYIIEKSTDGGTTWTDITTNYSETLRKRLVGGDLTSSIVFLPDVSATTTKIRFCFDATAYVFIGDLYMYLSPTRHTHTTKIIKKKDDSSSWEYHTNSELKTGGWPTHLHLPFSTIYWQNSTGAGKYRYIGVELEIYWNHNYDSATFSVYNIQFWGGYPAGKRTVYTVDENKHVIFPGLIFANDGTQKAVSLAGHNHDTSYADINHNHDSAYADISHNHLISEVTGLQAALDNKAASNHNHDTVYADINHNHDTVYSGIGHNHLISEVTGLQAALDNKAASNHNHDSAYASLAHQHGFITNDGTITQQVTDVNSAQIAIVNAGNKLLKGTNLVFNSTDSNYRQKYLSQYGTFENMPSGGSGGTGGGDVYLANNQEFTGINTFSNNVLLNHTASDRKVQINIGQQGFAKIVVNPGGNPEQQTTTFHLTPIYGGGEHTLLHTGNTKTINGNSIFGSGDISISGGGSSASGNWELLRARAASSSLTSVNSGTTIGSVTLTKSISRGDVLAIELNSTSSASYNPTILTMTFQTISTNPNSYNYDYNLESFTSWTGTELRVNNFSISASGTNLYFGNKKYIKGSFSGSTIEWTTNQSYTLYVGRVWRLVQ